MNRHLTAATAPATAGWACDRFCQKPRGRQQIPCANMAQEFCPLANNQPRDNSRGFRAGGTDKARSRGNPRKQDFQRAALRSQEARLQCGGVSSWRSECHPFRPPSFFVLPTPWPLCWGSLYNWPVRAWHPLLRPSRSARQRRRLSGKLCLSLSKRRSWRARDRDRDRTRKAPRRTAPCGN